MAKAAERLSLRERNKLRTRQEILDATLEVFNTDGFAGTSIDKIAEIGGISKGTVYVYFPDGLNDIYRDIYADITDRLLRTTRELRARNPEPSERILAMAEALLKLSQVQTYGRFYSVLSPELRPVLAPVVGLASKEFIVLIASDLKEMLETPANEEQRIALAELIVGSMREAARIVSEDPDRKEMLVTALRKIVFSLAAEKISERL
ncbi:TetR/AcrR family transcriptional regulator [Allorhizobium sp. BGMRC 0089]|uniref:TetR/AcrR family transcriptional regulator n=1 Tax=Allorhizobium sonneratiae TaxID=2934936 RepID=UPI0020337E18|nr:TetR/AcrR family transcriptional regulator [Allorhizobium sonneratiae]MCM2293943.1 TetR/AcrR family transcriptional regulator [Allorhizobium sonneratiae]